MKLGRSGYKIENYCQNSARIIARLFEERIKVKRAAGGSLVSVLILLFIMKFFVVLFAIIAAALAAPQFGGGGFGGSGKYFKTNKNDFDNFLSENCLNFSAANAGASSQSFNQGKLNLFDRSWLSHEVIYL